MKPDAPAPKRSSAPKVFDVMRPGKALANPSARPIIVGHKPQVQDSVSGIGSEGRSLQHGRRKVELNHSGPEEDRAAKTKPAISEQSKATQSKPDLKPEPAAPAKIGPAPIDKPGGQPEQAPEFAVPPRPKSQPETEQSDPLALVFDAPAQTTPPPAPDTGLTFDDTPAPIPGQQEIIVSHHGVLDEPFKIIGLLLLIIALAAVVVDILLDAGILSIDALPHTHFF